MRRTSIWCGFFWRPVALKCSVPVMDGFTLLQVYSKTIVRKLEEKALLHILDDVLDFSRLEAGRLQTEYARFSPEKVLEGVLRIFSQQAAEKGIELRVDIAPSISGHFLGDAGRLRQILLNLVGNALKFTENGSVVFGVRPAATGAGTEFFVKDTGPGIPPDQRDLIFQPFTQADSSISRRHGGTGLGLAICRRLTELLGGTLSFQSEVGMGTEFVVHLNMELSESGDPKSKKPQETTLDPHFAEQNPLRILVVEDDKVNRKLILALIKKLGYSPLAAIDGRDAVAIYQKEHPQCLLMDLQMPEMDGIEATEAIRACEAEHPEAPRAFIAALTANIFPADKQRCLDAGMDSYLNKPIKIAELTEILRLACDARSHPENTIN
jgi:CheY-like chemotaxis protein